MVCPLVELRNEIHQSATKYHPRVSNYDMRLLALYNSAIEEQRPCVNGWYLLGMMFTNTIYWVNQNKIGNCIYYKTKKIEDKDDIHRIMQGSV